MLRLLLNSIIKAGQLTVLTPRGSFVVGTGKPSVTIRIHDRRAMLALAMNPELALGELYMDRRLTVENGDIADLLELASLNLSNKRAPALLRVLRDVRKLFNPIRLRNKPRRAIRNVSHHYDLSAELYDLFLDRDRQYSCAYFSKPDMTLEQAQTAKKKHIAAKLHLDRPGLRVLDIGCGWGGLALDIARDTGAQVTGITLSHEQLVMAQQRAAAAGLANACRFELTDYRDVEEKYDRIVSVGMFEHVGAPYYDAYFRKIEESLAPGGVALVHTIGCPLGPGAYNPWIAKYIFPGGYIPALSEMTTAVERSRLLVGDVEILRLHYAYTLREWRRRFTARRRKAAELYDERFCRMWEFYLAGCEMAFWHGGLVVFQMQLMKQPNAVPITRDYMYEAERRPALRRPRAARSYSDEHTIR
ncbi:MAG TPA: cyclopropane-fatty-acyl-phospholipid synthase family protein [Hyphomonadaceae bacterium]|nr:cyclopropane-fatty-acyl-phospholipid synthase family protein [Hyphomonadaceae bacterium]